MRTTHSKQQNRLVGVTPGLMSVKIYPSFFFFNDPATTEIYPLSLHDALPICQPACRGPGAGLLCAHRGYPRCAQSRRSEEHTSELQSPCNLVCRLLLEKKKNYTTH